MQDNYASACWIDQAVVILTTVASERTRGNCRHCRQRILLRQRDFAADWRFWLDRERSSFRVARVGWGGYHYGNAYFRNVGVLLFGFGPDLLLIFSAARADSNPTPCWWDFCFYS
jgi:hypothetical protein